MSNQLYMRISLKEAIAKLRECVRSIDLQKFINIDDDTMIHPARTGSEYTGNLVTVDEALTYINSVTNIRNSTMKTVKDIVSYPLVHAELGAGMANVTPIPELEITTGVFGSNNKIIIQGNVAMSATDGNVNGVVYRYQGTGEKTLLPAATINNHPFEGVTTLQYPYNGTMTYRPFFMPFQIIDENPPVGEVTYGIGFNLNYTQIASATVFINGGGDENYPAGVSTISATQIGPDMGDLNA